MLKRIVVSIVGFSILLALYVVYVQVFGHLSSLPPIDPDLLRSASVIENTFTTNAATFHRTKQIARDVFGPESWQANADIALNWERSGVIIYILDYEPVDPKTLRLVPFSLVHIAPSKTTGAKSQIVTLEGKDAVLEFDRPVDPIRVTTAKPLGLKITGNVQIQADRGTPDPLDDFVCYTDNLEFNDEQKRIWTEAPVRIVSGDTVMTGTGGEIHLNHDDSKKPRDMPTFQGLRDFILFRDVRINMLSAAAGGLMAGSTNPRGESEHKTEKPKMPVSITCQGPFVYELEAEQGRFSHAVMMIRQTGDAQFDRLFSDELVIDFAKTKFDSPESAESNSDESRLQFRRAFATGRAVRVLSDEQAIEAIGTEMEHDAATGLTALRGEPEVVATQASTVLHGRELKFSPGEQGQRNAEAVGAGSIESRDPATGEIKLLARWNDGARIEPHADRQQLLTLYGAAEVDQPGRGTLAADRVKVWLSRGTADAESSAKDMPVGSSKWTPSRLEGIGNVVTKSDQFTLQAAHRLEMVIEDTPPPNNRQATLAIASTRTKTQDGAKSGTAPRGGKESDPVASRKRPVSETQDAKTEKPPAHLLAERIRIRALRDGERTEVAEVWTEGNVNLDQPPDENGANAVVVRGDNLYLKRIEQKNHLEVTGRPAHVEMQDLKVDGAHVCLDQPTGVAWVEGKGMMVLPSDTSFDGQKLDAPSELTISWGSNMVFTGDSAEFGGGVEAQQGTNRLRCQRLEAFLTERLDISAPRKKDQSAAKIEKLICTDAVALDNQEFRGGRLQKYDHLESRQLEFVNSSGQMTAQGPGIARSYTRGTEKIMPPSPNALGTKPGATMKVAKADNDQLLMTEIHFTDRMEADRTNQIAKFFGHIEVIRAPVANENELINPDNLPPNSMRLSCEMLEMATKKGPGDKPYNILLGEGNVDVEADVFYGRGDRISYDQLRERIIFESRTGSYATLYRQTRRGERWDQTRAFKIYYDLRTGDVKVEGGIEVDLQEREADRKNMSKPPAKKL